MLTKVSSSYHNLTMVMYGEGVCDDHNKTLMNVLNHCMRNRSLVEVKHILSGTEGMQRVILIEGDSGSGKSTLAMHIAQEVSADKLYRKFSLVILVQLQDFATRSAKCIADIVPIKGNRSTAEEIAYNIYSVEGEDVLFVLDGWNELPHHLRKNSIFHELIEPELSEYNRLSKSTVIVTSRHCSSGDLYPVISTHIELLGFTQEMVKSLLMRDTDGVDTLLERLQDNPVMEGKYCTPLNVSVLLNLFEDCNNTFPNTYTQLISSMVVSKVCDHIREHVQDKTLSLTLKDQLSSSGWRSLVRLSKLAYECMKDKKITFSSLPPDCKPLGLVQRVESLVDGISLVSYRFLHVSVQESLTAFYIATQLDEEKQVSFFNNYFDKFGFNATFCFYAAITKLQVPGIKDIAVRITEKCQKVTTPSAECKSSLLSLICSLYEAQNATIYEAAVSHIQKLNLNEVTLTSSQLLCVGNFLSYVTKSSSQTGKIEFYMERCGIDDNGCKYLACGIRKCLSIHSKVTKTLFINLANNDIHEKGVQHLSCLLKYRCLETLDLSCNCVLDEGAKHIASQLEDNTSLKILRMRFCGITSNGTKHMSNSLKENKHLECLDLSFNVLSDDDIRYIASALQFNKSLQTLNLRGCQLTEVGIDTLAEHSPCQIQIIDLDDGEEFKGEKIHPKSENENSSFTELCERWNSSIDETKSVKFSEKEQSVLVKQGKMVVDSLLPADQILQYQVLETINAEQTSYCTGTVCIHSTLKIPCYLLAYYIYVFSRGGRTWSRASVEEFNLMSEFCYIYTSNLGATPSQHPERGSGLLSIVDLFFTPHGTRGAISGC